MANTFDTSRVGGGTYELEQDSSGNYKLKSVGFSQVNKLNLPDLATSDTTSVADTTKKATEDTIKAQTTEVFKPTNIYQGGGEDARTFQDYERIVPKEAKVNEATVRSAGETIKSDMPQGSPGQLSKDKARAEANVELGLEPQNQYRSESAKFKERFDPTKIQAAAVKPNIIERAKTGITSAVDSVKNNKAIQTASNVLGFVTNPIIGGFKMVAGALNDPRQQALNKSNKDALSSLGYKTRGELGGSTDPGRIAGNPATNVFAGMNAQSAFGDPMRGARNRVSNIQKTIDKAKAKGDIAKAERFEARKEEFNRQIEEVQAKKNKADLATGGVAPGASGGGGGSGGGNTRVICTDLHRTKELSTRDWIRDTKFTFKTLSIKHVKGYLLWAEPTVRHIQKYPKYRSIWKHIAQHRANDIAWRLNEGKFDLLGRIYAGIGEPICWALGNFVSDKQINKYNLTHWRRA